MSENSSLEEEKRALLEQIHSSRETYRRMLAKSDTPKRGVVVDNVVNIGQMDQDFPRSMTMRWILKHPYASTAASTAVVAAAALLGTRSVKSVASLRYGKSNRPSHFNAAYMRPAVSGESSGRPRTARTRSTDFGASGNVSKPMTIARSLFTGLATAAAMLARDPRKLRTAANALSAAAGFVRARRSGRPQQKRAVKTVRVKG